MARFTWRIRNRPFDDFELGDSRFRNDQIPDVIRDSEFSLVGLGKLIRREVNGFLIKRRE